MKLTNDEKRAAAISYLGTKHVLHTNYDGRHTLKPDVETDIARTFKRITKQAEAERKAEQERLASIMNVRQINKRSA